MKVIIFGSNGMLGNYLKTFLSKSYTIIPFTREDYDIESNDIIKLGNLIKNVMDDDTIIVNCAGVIPQRNSIGNYKKYLSVNTMFPHFLNQLSHEYSMKFIHITTDCVYNGEKGNYNEEAQHNEQSLYGLSKSLGEPNNACIIRTSIIGEELSNKKSLLEWVLSNKTQEINGYANHYWNGITCLTLSEIIEQIINKKLYWSGVRHIFSPNIVTKYELCSYINELYQLETNIIKTEAPIYCNKSLTSLYNQLFKIDDIKIQIEKQRIYGVSTI